MTNYNPNSGFGQAMIGQIFNQIGPVMGRVLIVCKAGDPNFDRLTALFPPDNGRVSFYNTLKAAYDAAESNAHDVILLSAYGSHVLANGIAWTKSRIHVIGMDGGDRLIQQGAKVQGTSGTGDAYIIKVTGTRNTFRNIKFIQNDVTATSLHVLEEGGEGSLYQNCTFTFSVVDNLDLTTATEVLCGSDSATFLNCEFGTETLLTSAARKVFTIDQVTASQEFKSNRLQNCNFVISSSETTAVLLGVAANTDILFTNNIKDCTFVASVDSAGGVELAVAVSSVASLVKGTINFINCSAYACTNLMSDAVGNDGFYAYGPVNTGTDLVGLLGTAT